MGSDRASILIPLRRSHGLCVLILINTKTIRSLQRGCRKAAAIAMGIDCASIMIPLRRSHGLCVFTFKYKSYSLSNVPNDLSNVSNGLSNVSNTAIEF